MDNETFNNSGDSFRRKTQSFNKFNYYRDQKMKKSISVLPSMDHKLAGFSEDEVIDDDFESEGSDCVNYGSMLPADSTQNTYESFFEEEENNFNTHEVLSNGIYELMKSNSSRHLLEHIESGKIDETNLETHFRNASKTEINASFLWSAFIKLPKLFDGFLALGADLNYFEPSNGVSALHLSAFSGCLEGVKYLLSKKMSPNLLFKHYTPLHCAALGNSHEVLEYLLNHKDYASCTLNSSVFQENIIHCAVKANATSCIELLLKKGADVNLISSFGVSPLHIAADLGQTHNLRIMLDSKSANPNIRMQKEELTPLHLAAKGDYPNCIEVLLEHKADTKLQNYQGQTPLHLAARYQAIDCVSLLLRKGKCDPNTPDRDKRTPLHAALVRTAENSDIIEMLIKGGANVNSRDQFGHTPIHIAALNEQSQCVESLIFHGADVTAKTQNGMCALGLILRKTPTSFDIIKDKFDYSISLHESSNKEVEVRLNFKNILHNSYPREINFLNTFVEEGMKEILLHPLCSAFLYLKWEKIRKFYFTRLLFYFIFILFYSLYVYSALAHNCYNLARKADTDMSNTTCTENSILGKMVIEDVRFFIDILWYVLIGMTVTEVIRKLGGINGYKSFRQYFTQFENIIEWLVIISVILVTHLFHHRTFDWQNHIAAFAILIGWTNFMLMLGKLPFFGVYIEMYTKVQGEFTKLLLAYSCLLIGFTISFCIIFPKSDSYSNPILGFISVLVMMTGEIQLDLLTDEKNKADSLNVSAQITFVLFLLFITIILMNLLVGIAVHDIQGLQKTAGLSKLVRQTKLISYMESTLFNNHLPKYILNILYWSALVSPKAYRVVLNVKPLNPRENRLPKEILQAAFEIAKKRKNYKQYYSSRMTVRNRCNKDKDIYVDVTQVQILKELKELKSVINDLLNERKSTAVNSHL